MEIFEDYYDWRLVRDLFDWEYDCSKPICRKDFTTYCKLNEEIGFKEMLYLEYEYERLKGSQYRIVDLIERGLKMGDKITFSVEYDILKYGYEVVGYGLHNNIPLLVVEGKDGNCFEVLDCEIGKIVKN